MDLSMSSNILDIWINKFFPVRFDSFGEERKQQELYSKKESMPSPCALIGLCKIPHYNS
jgi:hypothetical protein